MEIGELETHLRRGGAATLNHPATYSVASGGLVAPARYAGRSGSEFVFETRYLDGEFRSTVLIDSKQSQSNRSEDGLVTARREGGPAAAIPTLSVVYPQRALADLELPHRAFDAHVRAATQEGEPVVKQDWYQALRGSSLADLSPIFTASPATIAFGGWDSSRKSGQLRLRSQFVSELFGVVSDDENRLSRRSGARLDPLGQDFHLKPDEFERLLEGQHEEMSEKKVKQLEGEIAKARKAKGETTISASSLGLGGVPPSLETAYGVSVPEVRRARTYSLAGLRRLRFGESADDDVCARMALMGMLLLGAAYADADPEIRAYCDVSAPSGRVFLDEEEAELNLSIAECTKFLSDAIDGLPSRLRWAGDAIEVDGDPALDRGAIDAEAGDDAESG